MGTGTVPLVYIDYTGIVRAIHSSQNGCHKMPVPSTVDRTVSIPYVPEQATVPYTIIGVLSRSP